MESLVVERFAVHRGVCQQRDDAEALVVIDGAHACIVDELLPVLVVFLAGPPAYVGRRLAGPYIGVVHVGREEGLVRPSADGGPIGCWDAQQPADGCDRYADREVLDDVYGFGGGATGELDEFGHETLASSSMWSASLAMALGVNRRTAIERRSRCSGRSV